MAAESETGSVDASQALLAREKVRALLQAAKDGDIELLNKTAQGVDEGQSVAETILGVKDANGRGALHFAAREGKTDMCKYLVEGLKLSADLADNEGETPLLHAARQGHVETAKYLLNHGKESLAAFNDVGITALHHAAATGSIELIELFLSKGLPVDIARDAGTPLIWAAGHHKTEAVKVLLDYGANPNAETEDNVTPLVSAVAAGAVDCVELLAKAGANVNVHVGGGTPLHIAADSGNEKMITCLLGAEADPNAKDEDDRKPILVAASQGKHAAVEILFKVTSPDATISDWSVNGILQYAEKMNSRDKELHDILSEKSQNNEKPQKTVIEVSAANKTKALEAKSRGAEAFKGKDYSLAVDAYTQAIDLDPSDAVIFSNRSLCWIRLGQAEQALADARMSRELRPDWPKAWYREGSALRLLQRFEEAAEAFYEGAKLAPENKELVTAFRETVEEGKKFHGTG